jgi:hypothetical protein
VESIVESSRAIWHNYDERNRIIELVVGRKAVKGFLLLEKTFRPSLFEPTRVQSFGGGSSGCLMVSHRTTEMLFIMSCEFAFVTVLNKIPYEVHQGMERKVERLAVELKKRFPPLHAISISDAFRLGKLYF